MLELVWGLLWTLAAFLSGWLAKVYAQDSYWSAVPFFALMVMCLFIVWLSYPDDGDPPPTR